MGRSNVAEESCICTSRHDKRLHCQGYRAGRMVLGFCGINVALLFHWLPSDNGDVATIRCLRKYNLALSENLLVYLLQCKVKQLKFDVLGAVDCDVECRLLLLSIGRER
jgi:hypothetical protein